MAKQFINPPQLHRPGGYTHAVAASGGKMIFVSGQVAVDSDAQIVGRGDLAAQARQAYQNLSAALAGAGASLADIVKMNTYIVNYKPADYRALNEVRKAFFAKDNPPASTMVGVTALAVEGLMIEVEAIAVV